MSIRAAKKAERGRKEQIALLLEQRSALLVAQQCAEQAEKATRPAEREEAWRNAAEWMEIAEIAHRRAKKLNPDLE